MKSLLLAVSGLALSTGAALAATDGCPPESTSIEYASASVVSAIFSAFSATPIAEAKCTLSLPVLTTPGKLTAYKADYRGYVPEGSTAHLRIDQNGARDEVSLKGSDDDFRDLHYVVPDENGSLTSDITLSLESPDDTSEAFLDSIDYAKVAETTVEDLDRSIDQIASEETAIATHLNATAGLLTGSDQPLVGDNDVSVIGGVGSYTLGLKGRGNLAEGWSVLGGLSLVDQSASGVSYGGLLGSAAVRYVDPTSTGFRPFGEVGITGGALNATFTRTYDQGTGTDAVGAGTGDVDFGSIYGRAGVLIDVDDMNQVAVSGTLQGTALSIGGYDEAFSDDNAFAASLPAQTARFTTAKATAAWTTKLTDTLDLTATGSVGATLAHDPVVADVAFAGEFESAGQGTVFGEYGLRLGWDVAPNTKVDAFVQGSTGVGVGTHAQIGSSVHLKF